MTPAAKLMHLFYHRMYLLPERRREGNRRPPPGLTIEERAFRDGTAEHLLQTQGLGAQLQLICQMGFGGTFFIFHRKGEPQSIFSPERDSVGVCMKFYYIKIITRIFLITSGFRTVPLFSR